ncbi:DNA topoisomerase IB [Adhaeribacter radiodurans]|uniref:DNA topoisomerase n=1 Tax=Adhaeribacter radiodurans TaxID=2745197 RepID=A0A7L7L6L5_9BACT|nr:DNA topoisomerase IB [Adhaeribacter radiodurans]QMU28394.1 DNA topoisomerase IB [Adhaeribacter radiodurans]
MEEKDVHVLYADPVQSAAEAGLRYIPDTGKGFNRKRSGKGFTYLDTKGEKITDPKILDRLKKLIIPPAWENVWICPSPNGHIQVTGRDTKGRKQYIYHPEWRNTRSLTKFSRMISFGETLPTVRQQIEKDLLIQSLNQRKVTAIVLNLLDQSLIRIGNRQYAEANKSYGLTTLRDKHVAIEGDQVKFQFVGKKGVSHEIDIKDRRLARLVKKCKDIPGFDLFQYYDEDGTRQTLESGQVNQYIQEISGADFTAKDFRTWGGTVLMVECLEKLLDEKPELEKEKSVKDAFKTVAKGLGNTPAVCSKYYVHPQILEIFKNDQLLDYLKKHAADQPSDPYLSSTEKMVIQMLKSALPNS